MDRAPIRGDDGVIVREDVPETASDQLAIEVSLGRKLSEDVIGGEAVREQPRKEGRALPLRELFAVGQGRSCFS